MDESAANVRRESLMLDFRSRSSLRSADEDIVRAGAERMLLLL